MRAIVILLASIFLMANARAQSDPFIASVQQKLKEQGFYYGEATGRKDADTTAAIRRYQIRNGLQITGELSAETQKSLGVKGPVVTPTAPPRAPQTMPTPSNLRGDQRPIEQTPRPRQDEFRAPAPPENGMEIGPPPSEIRGVFNGTPYERAPVEAQQRVIASAQSLLARRGYYRDLIDGVFGPGTEFAVRAFQSRFGIVPDGRLNRETLGALGLLPGQRAAGVTVYQRREGLRPRTVAPNGEPVYTPR